MSVIDRHLQNDAAYSERFDKGDLAAPPADHIAVVACMDARMETGALLGLTEGGAHVIRNAGGAVTEDVIRSLTVSQCVLGTREIMIVHHTRCGMCGSSDDELKKRIEQVTGARPPFAMETFCDLEADVRQSMARIRESQFIPYKDGLRGFVYEVESGLLREVK